MTDHTEYKNITLESDPPFPDYLGLVSPEDRQRYFKGCQYKYDDPLTIALIRCTEKLADSIADLKFAIREVKESLSVHVSKQDQDESAENEEVQDKEYDYGHLP